MVQTVFLPHPPNEELCPQSQERRRGGQAHPKTNSEVKNIGPRSRGRGVRARRSARQKPCDCGSDSLCPPLPPRKSGLWPGPPASALCPCPPPSPHTEVLSPHQGPCKPRSVRSGLLCKCSDFGQSEARVSIQISRQELKFRVRSNTRGGQKVDVEPFSGGQQAPHLNTRTDTHSDTRTQHTRRQGSSKGE